MSKSAKQRPAASSTASVAPASSARSTASDRKIKTVEPNSKQSRVIAMLRSSSGSTIAAMMKVTGWQPHSVRGFLAGVVRKRLKLKLGSKKVDGNRVYRVTGRGGAKSGLRPSKRRSS
jgi:hypothetical protein